MGKRLVRPPARLAALLTAAACLCACAPRPAETVLEQSARAKEIRVGVVLVTDESDNGYSYNHMLGLNAAVAALGLPAANVTVRRNVIGDYCERAMRALVDGGADIIFATSFEYEPAVLALAKQYPNVEFCHASGSKAVGSNLPNMHNYFPKIHEARYLAGIAAGLKALEIENPRLGYVGAYNFAEVISGYTAFYLGAKSVNPDVTMDVIYTDSWGDHTLEYDAARRLIDMGCGVISQHSDTTAPAIVAQEMGAFHVGYNSDMISFAPDASLVSARIDWSAYYQYALSGVMYRQAITPDWSGGLAEHAVYLSPLNTPVCAKGTAEAIETAARNIATGSPVFAGPLHGVSPTATLNLAAGQSYAEGVQQSAPTFDFIVDGITEVKD